MDGGRELWLLPALTGCPDAPCPAAPVSGQQDAMVPVGGVAVCSQTTARFIRKGNCTDTALNP